MKSHLIVPILIGAMTVSISVMAQQPAPTTVSYLQASLAAMAGKTTIQDVTLNGTVEMTAGENDETAPAVLRSLSDGSSRIDLSLSSGVKSDIRIGGPAAPTGTWSNGDGVQHPISGHNLMTDSPWFFPDLIVSRMVSNPTLTVVFVGQEGNLLHFQTYQQQPGAPASVAPLLQHLTQSDLYLDSTTLLPAQLNFNIHPDGNASVDIPVTIQYSNYEAVNGVLLPFHVQKYFNNSLAMDLQIQTAVFNSGITISAPNAQ